jgi:hypothetical protein
MTWKQVRAEALRVVDEVAQRRSDLELTEYQNEARYRVDCPAGRKMLDHNGVVHEAFAEQCGEAEEALHFNAWTTASTAPIQP